MVESQPGQVTAFDPSVALSGFTAETRDQLISNENQLVLAKLQQPLPTQAIARSRLGPDNFLEFGQYVNSDGSLVYIDGSFQALSTAGVPTSNVHQIQVGFNIQVTTDTVIFWSLTFVETDDVFVEYSFEDITWFPVGAVTWVQFFDDTIENFPGDAPPTGQFRYTGTFDGGEIKARYWRIRSDAETKFISESGSSPTKTLTVTANSTSNFPVSGSLFGGQGDEIRSFSYTGKSASTFTGVTDDYGTPTQVIAGSVVDPFAGNGNYVLNLVSTSSLPPAGSATMKPVSVNVGDPVSFSESSASFISWTGKIDGNNQLTGVSFGTSLFTYIEVVGGAPPVLYYILLSGARYKLAYTPFTLTFGSTIFNFNYFADNVTEVQIIPSFDPILQHWNSDGSQAVSVLVGTGTPYAAAYDKADDAYYVIKFNTDLQGATIDPNDNFNADTGTSFDTEKWTESATNVYFQHSTSSGTLDFSSSGGPGQLVGNYIVEDDFIADIEFVHVGEINQKAYFSLEAKDASTGNVHMSSVLKGAYIPGVSTISGTFSGATMTYTDTMGGAALLQDFRVNPAVIDYTYAGGIVNYSVVYNGAIGAYNVTVSGISHALAFPGIPYTMDSASFTVVNLTPPANGQSFSIDVFVNETSVAGTLASGISLQIERIGTNAYVRYDETPGVFVTLFTGNIPTNDMRVQLFADPKGQVADVLADNFQLTGTVVFGTPVFSVVTLDTQGNIKEVSGVSDSNGYAIQTLDLIRDSSATFNTFLSPRVGIATNGALAGSGGEIYLKINDVLYRYLKTALPLLSIEDGSSAAATSTGEIPSTSITNFAYNGYSQGGLSYIEFDSDLGGVFLRSIKTADLLAVPLKVLLDVATIDYPFAWNVTDLATLYFVDAGALKLYDLNETKAGFVNITSDKQVLAAGTAETATITAQVLNVYGEPKSSKSLTFTVSAGDGAVSPATGCSNGSGEDTTVYTVGSAVGTATITVTVSDISCIP